MKWLAIDGNYLAWRAYHTTGQLDNGVVYGVLRDALSFAELHAADAVAWCFDRGTPKRKLIYPTYKANRTSSKDPLIAENYNEVRRQILELRTKILPGLGFNNVLSQEGYEADDMIAQVVYSVMGENWKRSAPHKAYTFSTVIVSADHDLYQLIDPQTVCWNPTTKEVMNRQRMEKDFGVCPEQWAEVKAIAGCKSDNVRGVVGVGEFTACRYVNGTLPAKSKAYQKIVAAQDLIDLNLGVVRLPFPGAKEFVPQKDEVSPGRWREVVRKLGMPSLARRK